MPASIFREIIAYFDQKYGIIGVMAAEELLHSLCSYHLNHYLVSQGIRGRNRRHVLLFWDPGWVKTSFLTHFLNIVDGVKWAPITSLTPPTIYGSMSANKKFYPPELLINDIICIGELSSVLSSADHELTAQLLAALEEGHIRVARIKFGDMKEEDLEKYPEIKFEDGRIEYDTSAIFWAATHTLDNLNKHLREAFLQRFVLVEVPYWELTNELTRKILSAKVDYKREAELKKKLAQVMNNGIGERLTEDKIDFVQSYTDKRIQELEGVFRISPRLANDIQKPAYYFSCFTDNQTEIQKYIDQRFQRVKRDDFRKLPLRDQIIIMLEKQPYTVKKLVDLTRGSKSSVYSILAGKEFKRLPSIPDPNDKRKIAAKYTLK